MARQAAAVEKQNRLLEDQNKLLSDLVDNSAEAATGGDIRGLKQYLGKVASGRAAA